MPRAFSFTLDEFRREIDELFDQMLIDRWRVPAGDSEPAILRNRADSYEARFATGDIKPQELEVEVTEKRLTVRTLRASGRFWERVLNLPEAVQTENVTARWGNRYLTVVMPKKVRPPHAARTKTRQPNS